MSNKDVKYVEKLSEKDGKKFIRNKLKFLTENRKTIYEACLKNWKNLSKGDELHFKYIFKLEKF